MNQNGSNQCQPIYQTKDFFLEYLVGNKKLLVQKNYKDEKSVLLGGTVVNSCSLMQLIEHIHLDLSKTRGSQKETRIQQVSASGPQAHLAFQFVVHPVLRNSKLPPPQRTAITPSLNNPQPHSTCFPTDASVSFSSDQTTFQFRTSQITQANIF